MSRSSEDISDPTCESFASTCSSGLLPFQRLPQMCIGPEPQLKILVQPQGQFRFRYESDNKSGSHGCIPGVCNDDPNKTRSNKHKTKKTYPTVELLNFEGKAKITCELIQKNNEEEHPHRITMNKNKHQSIFLVPNKISGYVASFRKLKILCLRKGEVLDHLKEKHSDSLRKMDKDQVDVKVKKMAESIDLDVVRLKFTAIDLQSKGVLCTAISDPINNDKSTKTNKLKICQYNRVSGKPEGKEDLYLFVEKVDRKTIKVRFYELDEKNKVCWEAFGNVISVHRQFGIYLTTPPYKNTKITKNVKVWMELVRTSEEGLVSRSEPREFTYKPNPKYRNSERMAHSYRFNKKRKIEDMKVECATMTLGNEIEQQAHTATAFVQKDMLSTAFQADYPLIIVDTNGQNVDPIPIQVETIIGHNENSQNNNLVMIYPLEYELPTENNCILPDDSVQLNENQIRSPLKGGDPMLAQNSQFMNYCDPMDAVRKNNITQPDSPGLVFNMLGFDDLNSETDILNDLLNATFGGQDTSENGGDNFIADSGRTKKDKKIKNEIDEEYCNIKGHKLEEVSEECTNGRIKKLIKEMLSSMKKQKDRDFIQEKLEQLLDIRFPDGDTYLHNLLVRNANAFVWMVRLIFSLGLPHLLYVTNESQQTVLHYAAMLDMLDTIAFLIEVGCDPMVEDVEGKNAFHFAATQSTHRCLETLLEVAKKNEVEIDLDAFNFEKQTPLHFAVTYGCEESVRVLLRHGASVTVRDVGGRAPLHRAVAAANVAAVRALLTTGDQSDIDAVDARGLTALQTACEVNDISSDTLPIIKLLLEYDANPFKNENGTQSALERSRNRPEMWKVFKDFENKTGSDDEYFSADEEESS